MSEEEKDWKLKLRYGKVKTPYQHFTVIAKGIAEEPLSDFNCPKGNAYMGMKCWATSTEEAADMIQSIGNHIGFTVNGNIEIFTTEPVEPPAEKPFGYSINFNPFRSTDLLAATGF